MIVDRKDISDVVAKRHFEARQQLLPMAKMLAAAAPVSDVLTRSPEWERYVTYLQGVAEQFKGRKAVALGKLGDPSVVRDEEVRKLRQDIFEADVWINALRFAVELPAYIRQGGDEAQKFIQQIEKKNETTGNA